MGAHGEIWGPNRSLGARAICPFCLEYLGDDWAALPAGGELSALIGEQTLASWEHPKHN
jgi:hypothetical protein